MITFAHMKNEQDGNRPRDPTLPSLLLDEFGGGFVTTGTNIWISGTNLAFVARLGNQRAAVPNIYVGS